ncbi:MAG TPA: DUF971 domain-containing protein [Hyphomicrobiales bacterium]|nr:DUF971 domain-containing protein [Hyphomicrobiales bacterium]
MTPDRLIIRDDGAILRIFWPDGRSDDIKAALLRQESRSARSRRAQIDNCPSVSGDVRIESVDPVGTYAVNIGFSDGEHRGIYPWDYLAELSARTSGKRLSASDFMIEGETA